jgi:nucleoid DNA-binding protein
MAKAPAAPAKKAPSKSEVINNIAEATELSKKQVSAVFDALGEEIKKAMGNRGAGVFQIPGLVKVTKKKVPAKPAQKNVMNPFTKEIGDRPAKPAYNKIVVRALKNLKDMA